MTGENISHYMIIEKLGKTEIMRTCIDYKKNHRKLAGIINIIINSGGRI